MISETHIKTIKSLAQLFEEGKISWKLVGSANLALQGVEVAAKDIDISTNETDIYKIDALLKEHCIEAVHYKESPNFRSTYGLYKINDIQIEVMADLESNNNGVWVKSIERKTPPIFIEVNNIKIPVTPLQEEYEAYSKLGRVEKAEIIKRTIEKLASN